MYARHYPHSPSGGSSDRRSESLLGMVALSLGSHPWASAVTVFCLLVASVAEGIGIAALLPLLSLTADSSGGSQAAIGQAIEAGLRSIGLQPSIEILLATIVVAMSLKAVLVMVAMRRVGFTAARVMTDLRLSLITAVAGARWQFFVSQRIGQLASAIGIEARRAAQGYLSACRLTASAVQAAVFAITALFISWEVTVGALLVGGLTFVALRRLVRATREAGRRQTHQMSALTSRLVDAWNGYKAIKAMGSEGRVSKLLKWEIGSLEQSMRRVVAAREAMAAFQEPVAIIALAIGIYVLIDLWAGRLETLVVIAVLFSRTVQHINKIQKEQQALGDNLAALQFIQSILQGATGAEETRRSGVAPTFSGQIRLQNVEFAYDDNPVLREVTLTIPAGYLVVLTGPSGSGKTTIADLICGLLEPRSGEVLIDGRPLRDLDLPRWRQMIGYVPQETFLFHDTLFANVTLGDPAFKHQDVERALRAAGAWDFVKELPQGLDTIVGERGTRFSGGQRQRISIARALVRGPNLLVVDEATSAVDPKTEAAICETLRQLSGQVTILAISHQTRMIEAADLIYAVEGGTAHKIAKTPMRTPSDPTLATRTAI